MPESSPQRQIEFVQRIAANDAERAAFIANPDKVAAKHKVELDPKFAKAIRTGLAKIDKDRIRIVKGTKSGHAGPGGPKMNAVVAAAAVVTAAAAVVTAVSATYTATKWRAGQQAGSRIKTMKTRTKARTTKGRARRGAIR